MPPTCFLSTWHEIAFLIQPLNRQALRGIRSPHPTPFSGPSSGVTSHPRPHLELTCLEVIKKTRNKKITISITQQTSVSQSQIPQLNRIIPRIPPLTLYPALSRPPPPHPADPTRTVCGSPGPSPAGNPWHTPDFMPPHTPNTLTYNSPLPFLML